MRMCCVTRERLPKVELIRVVRTPDGVYELDLSGKKNGRGVYLKKDINVFEKARDKKMLNRAFDDDVNVEIYNELIDLLK